MKKYRATYRSMTATYELGTYFAETKKEAERQARDKYRSDFTAGERTLIHCQETEE